jgi:hypothetical protein
MSLGLSSIVEGGLDVEEKPDRRARGALLTQFGQQGVVEVVDGQN